MQFLERVQPIVLAHQAQPPVRSDRKRVLHVFDHSLPLRSGYSIRSQGLMRAQASIGYAPEGLTGPLHQIEDTDAKDMALDGLLYRRTWPRSSLERRALDQRVPVLREMAIVHSIRNRIVQLMSEEPFDIVHAHSPALCGLAALQAAATRKAPVVYEIRAFWEDAAVDQGKMNIRSARYQMIRRLESYVAQRADAVVGIARHILDDLQKRGVETSKLFHVPNGVDTGRFAARSRDSELALRLGLTTAPVLGFIGSLYRYEGMSWLVRACARLRQEGSAVQLVIVGQGEDLADTRKAVIEAGAEQYVRLIGEVPNDQVERYYSVVDVMIYPRLSTRLTELTTPLKLLEAMAQAKAVLASDVGGIRELVGLEPPCLLFRSGDVDDFCDKARQLISDADFRRDLGQRAREMTFREMDWKIAARRYEAVYDYAVTHRQRTFVS